MKRYKYIILGAGPAGLTFANLLKQNGEDDFVLLEMEEDAGGLCRSRDVDGAPLDIGGGHFLDVRRPKVNEFLFRFMPKEEWNQYVRISKIDLNGMLIDHPIEANIWEMDIESQISYLKSIAAAGCNQNVKEPEKFVDWIYWKLGEKISEDYMIPYNSKIFSKNLDELGTYWLDKLPNVSFDNTLRSSLMRRPFGEQPGHAEFYYPKKYGYGELWRRMADAVCDQIRFSTRVDYIDFGRLLVGCTNGDTMYAEKIITTIPWREFDRIDGMPAQLQEQIQELKHSSIQIEYYERHMDTNAHWIYYPDINLSYHRILVRHNFCPNSRGYWTETNCDRLSGTRRPFSFYNRYAYPLNTIKKPKIMDKLIQWSREYHVYPLGRWGEHQHYNSDVTVEKAMELFHELEKNDGDHREF